jgi:hypothetical protein
MDLCEQNWNGHQTAQRRTLFYNVLLQQLELVGKPLQKNQPESHQRKNESYHYIRIDYGFSK